MPRKGLLLLSVSLLAIVALASALAVSSPNANLHEKIRRLETEADVDSLPPAQWFTQQLDHFNHQDNRTWQQRYFLNDSYYDPNMGGPIFFQFGGEGPISPFYVTLLEYVNYAQKFGALVVALEHRFYGESAPLPDLSTGNLAYLSSEQALADAALFISWLKTTYNTSTSVVTFGCSYPGNLAAWFRLKYPQVTDMSVASSSPVQAVEDFFEYLDVVDNSIQYFTGEVCLNIISNATNQIETMLQTVDGQNQLQQLFNTCTPLNNTDDVSNFMGILMGNWMGTVQYNNELENPLDVSYLCNYLINASNNGTNPLAGYAQLNNQLFISPQGECLDISYADEIQFLQNTNQSADAASSRAWIYQTCTEFGYFQTTDSSNQPFGNLVPLNDSLQMCIDIFGQDYNPPQRIAQTNVYYGGKNIKNGPTNILFVNGDIDPWHVLGITANISSTLPAILIDGTAHCANVLPPEPNDPPGLLVARAQTVETIGKWLAALQDDDDE